LKLCDYINKYAGISDIVISTPRIYIPLANRNNPEEPTEFSLSRIDKRTGKPTNPLKYLNGIGVAKMAVPEPYQDASTLATNAIHELIQRNDIRPKDINRIEIGTETGPDESKSISM
jgi:3-hydroxy-3-methylglutaryl CoA synthase